MTARPDGTPTTGDAIRRRLASYPSRNGGRGIARVVCVRNGRVTLRLPSGAHVTCPADEVRLIAQPAPRVLP